jgi:hypothetical protein
MMENVGLRCLTIMRQGIFKFLASVITVGNDHYGGTCIYLTLPYVLP